ncbi:Cupin domain protein [Catalinimonas alkaloidigena]|uniref:Cupin domain protein n=1 Tax=Catalinimonas alkaloidigena TaxID=1075417 RepID=A0A1G9S8Y0_9BACT|nr:cupin domain-containing protein [Catalinimonas alkaloidigena]SDM31938.1 Cupin domain protein [Catalinimonas alkaloidigena]
MNQKCSTPALLASLTLLFLAPLGCTSPAGDTQPEAIFPKGEQGPTQNFTGKAWNYGLVPNDSTYNTVVGNVYFEPGARSNWHTHPGGQILIITDGVGYHQIEGQPRETLRKGDVAQCPPNTRHWHGASPDTGMQQLYIVTNTDKGIVDWMEPVTDEVYAAAE